MGFISTLIVCSDRLINPLLSNFLEYQMKDSHNHKRTRIRIEFGKRVRQKRHFLDLSQEKLAEIADLHPN